MRVGEVFECEIISLGINGEGVAKVESFVIFVPFALVGEIARIEIATLKDTFATAKVVEIIKASKDRIVPSCQYFGKCGGCQLQHLSYQKQLEFKRQKVEQTLEKFLKKKLNVENCIASQMQFNYRNKIELLFSEEGLGYFDNFNKKIIKINNCPIFCENIEKITEIFNKLIKNNKNIAYNAKNNSGIFKSLIIRHIEDSYVLTLVATCMQNIDCKNIIFELNKLNINYSLFVSENNTFNSTNITHKLKLIHGEITQKLDIENIKIKLSPNSFLQINQDVYLKIYKDICRLILPSDVVIDAYSGAGLLSAIISKVSQKVYAVEIIENASKDADALCQENNIDNIKNICGDCSKVLVGLAQDNTVSAVVLDPPRKGCDKKVLSAIISSEIEKIIYLSCNVATLSRDLALLQEHYNIKKITPYDMFPQTFHVETLVLLERIKKS